MHLHFWVPSGKRPTTCRIRPLWTLCKVTSHFEVEMVDVRLWAVTSNERPIEPKIRSLVTMRWPRSSFQFLRWPYFSKAIQYYIILSFERLELTENTRLVEVLINLKKSIKTKFAVKIQSQCKSQMYGAKKYTRTPQWRKLKFLRWGSEEKQNDKAYIDKNWKFQRGILIQISSMAGV